MARYPKIIQGVKDLLLFVLLFALLSWGIDLYRAPKLEGRLPALSGITIQGRPAKEAIQSGRPFILHFWGTWCPVCRQEADNLQHLDPAYGLLSVAVKSGGDAELLTWMQERKLDYPVLNDSQGRLAARLGIGVYPTTLLFDGAGRLRFALTGYTTTLGLLARLKWIELTGEKAAPVPKNP